MSQVYHASPAISRTDLLLFRESRRQFFWVKSKVLSYPRELESRDKLDNFAIGTATHTLVLEPWDSNSIVVFDGKRAGDAWKRYQRANATKVILTEAQFIRVCAMSGAVKEVIGQLFENGKCEFEKHIEWTESVGESSVKCRALLDSLLLYGDRAIILDLKTCKDARSDKFRRTAADWSYWLQAEHYSRAVHENYGTPLEHIDFIFVAVSKSVAEMVEKSCRDVFKSADTLGGIQAEIERRVKPVAPLMCRLHRLSERDREDGRRERSNLLRSFVDCTESGDWSDEGELEINTLDGTVKSNHRK